MRTRIGILSVIAFVLALYTVPPSVGATLTVTSLADDGSSGTLRSVIASANSGDAITFSVAGTITLTQGTIEINKNVTLSGKGPSIVAISGNNQATVFQVDAAVSVVISGVTVENGVACTSFSCNGEGGGGIRNKGTLTVSNSVISNSGTGCNCNEGGGILNEGTLSVMDSTILANGAAYGGGVGNSGTLTVVNSTFASNGASFGGGIYNSGPGTIASSTFYHNGASQNGPAINGGGSLTVKGTLFANNSFLDGLGNPGGPGSCTNIISGGYNLSDDNSCSTFLIQTGDLNNTPANVDSNGLQNNGGPTPTLALLSLSAAVNAIPLISCTDAAGNPLPTDQRGVARPQDGLCDIGAFELQADTDAGLADLNGGNSFTGNQAVNGSVTATSFIGDGSGLTNVTASTANNANFAMSAGDAMTLGGTPASGFAPATGSPIYVAKAGDTMTGTLNLPLNGLAAGSNQFVLSGGNVGIGTATPEAVSGYTSLHIDNAGTGFGGSFLELTHSATGAKGRVVMDDNGLLLAALNAEPVKIKSGNFNGGADPGHIYIGTNGNVGIGSGTPGATLEVNGTAKFDNTVTFAPGQTFPGTGTGTITGVSAGTGLSGGGISGNVALTNTGLLSLTAGTGINSTGGQTPTLSLNPTYTDSRYAQLGAANVFTANQTVNGSVSATIVSAATLTASTATFSSNVPGGNTVVANQTADGTAVNGTGSSGGGVGVAGQGYVGVVGNSTSLSGAGTPVGVLGTANYGVAGRFIAWNNAKILSGVTNNGSTEVFSVANNGNVTTSGSLIIGGGTPIVEYVSTTLSIALPALTSGSCTTFSSAALTGYTPGTSDTIALGVPADLVSLSKVFVIWQAWETSTSGSPTITVQVCNPSASRYAGGAADTIRIDVFKH